MSVSRGQTSAWCLTASWMEPLQQDDAQKKKQQPKIGVTTSVQPEFQPSVKGQLFSTCESISNLPSRSHHQLFKNDKDGIRSNIFK